MSIPTLPDFIVIDDDTINNMICHRIIQLTIPGASVQTFLNPEKGLEYLRSNYSAPDANKAMLFLDINMPLLTGWEVLDIIRTFPRDVTDRIKIYMLSSSVNPQEKEKADNNPLVSGYITKSLSQEKMRMIYAAYTAADGVSV